MSIFPLFAPINPPSRATARLRVFRQMFVGRDHASRSALEMQPGKISRPSADKRLRKREHHHEQARVHGIELRFDPGANHVRERDAECSAKHQIGHDAQGRQKNAEPEKKNR